MVVNPNKNATAVFVHFLLRLDIRIVPFIDANDNGTLLKASVDLDNAGITMEEGAFPPAWKDFIQDLVKGKLTASAILESFHRITFIAIIQV